MPGKPELTWPVTPEEMDAWNEYVSWKRVKEAVKRELEG